MDYLFLNRNLLLLASLGIHRKNCFSGILCLCIQRQYILLEGLFYIESALNDENKRQLLVLDSYLLHEIAGWSFEGLKDSFCSLRPESYTVAKKPMNSKKQAAILVF